MELVHMNIQCSSPSQKCDKEVIYIEEKIWNVSREEVANWSILNEYLPTC